MKATHTPWWLRLLQLRLIHPRLRAQIVKELLLTLRDPKARVVLVLSPLLQLFLFTFAATLEVESATIAVQNRDGGRWSQELIASLQASSFVGELRQVHGNDALRDAIDAREALLALSIPDDFSRRIAAGQSAPLQVIVDGRRANAGQIALGYLETIASRLGASLQPQSLQRPDIIAVRHWFNPNLIYQWFILPSLVGTMAMLVPLLITAMSIARERELGTFDQLLVSPTTPTEIIIAKAVPAVLIGFALGMAMVAAGVWGFGVPFHGSLLLLTFCMLLFITSVVGLGLMLSAISSTQQQAILGTFAAAVPMVLLSGFATPVENMPEFLQLIAEAIPVKHFLIILEGSFLKAMPPAEIWRNAWPMGLLSVITLVMAVGLVKSRLQ
jgi:ABC-2 type transport system permease protein